MDSKEQTYKIEVIMKADVSDEPVKDWLLHNLKSSDKVVKVYTVDIQSIDRNDAKYEFLKHFE